MCSSISTASIIIFRRGGSSAETRRDPHLPIYRWPVMRGVFETMYRSRKTAGNVFAHVRRFLLQLGWSRPIMRGLSYSIEYLLDTLPQVGLSDVEVWIFCPKRDHKDPHPFVLARKGIDAQRR